MSIEELIEVIEIGHEIEFRLFENKYFLQPCYSHNKNHSGAPWFVIYDCRNSKNAMELFRGTCKDIIDYEFPKGISFKHNIDIFVFDAIF